MRHDAGAARVRPATLLRYPARPAGNGTACTRGRKSRIRSKRFGQLVNNVSVKRVHWPLTEVMGVMEQGGEL